MSHFLQCWSFPAIHSKRGTFEAVCFIKFFALFMLYLSERDTRLKRKI
jgi:hypothetical protein